MEFFGGDQEWESLSNIFSFEDSDHFLPEINATSNNDLFFPSDHTVDHFYFPGRAGDISFRADDFFHDHEKTNFAFKPTDFVVPSAFSDDTMADEILQRRDDDNPFVGMQLKRKQLETPENLPQIPEKVTRVSKEANKTMRKLKKSKKLDVQIEERNNGFGNENISPNGCSSDEPESGEPINGGKSKGPSTDPQSIYARKRRERINERLKTLQTLVPNGTKVDISTMLEEAVDYVKFLQLQIKLLSSDDMWMFAPIAYNGMDMGLYQKILPNL